MTIFLVIHLIACSKRIELFSDEYLIKMSATTDNISVLNIDDCTAAEIGVLSHIKTPIQHTVFTNHSDLISKALRQSILYFSKTLNTSDRPSCMLRNEFRSVRTHRC